MPFYLFVGVMLYIALANITVPELIASMLVPTLAGGVVSLLIMCFICKNQAQGRDE